MNTGVQSTNFSWAFVTKNPTKVGTLYTSIQTPFVTYDYRKSPTKVGTLYTSIQTPFVMYTPNEIAATAFHLVLKVVN